MKRRMKPTVGATAAGGVTLALFLMTSACTGPSEGPVQPAPNSKPSASNVDPTRQQFTNTGPCYDPSGRTDCGETLALLPPALQGILDFIETASGAYSKVTTAVGVLQKLADVTGLMEATPSGDSLIRELQAHLDKAARGIEFKIDAQFFATRYGEALGALINAKQQRDRGTPLDPSWSGYQNSIDVVIAAGNPDLFKRHYTDEAVAGQWMGIVSERAIVDNNGEAYDWRLALPSFLQLIALRLQVLAVIIPEFRNEVIAGTTISPYAEELNNIRNALMVHYQLIKDGVQCGTVHPSGLAGNDHTACADVNTGIQLVSAYGVSTTLLQTRLESMLPLYQLKALINSLAMYTDTSFVELTTPDQVIRRDEDGFCLAGNTGGITGPSYCDQTGIQWSYNRETGQIFSASPPFDNYCLVGGVPAGAAFAPTACGPGRPDGKWTYDPIDRTLMDGNLFYLTFGTMELCDEYNDPCGPVPVAMSSRNPAHWGSQR
jgi:hypothetical protein